jgi:hypothetical protein
VDKKNKVKYNKNYPVKMLNRKATMNGEMFSRIVELFHMTEIFALVN